MDGQGLPLLEKLSKKMPNNKIQQETWIPHEELNAAIKEWAEEVQLNQLPKEAQEIMIGVFTEGWSRCLSHTMEPARDLSLLLLQMSQIKDSKGHEDSSLVLKGQPLEIIEGLAKRIIGMPADWQLDDMVKAVEVDLDNPPEDLPEEVLEALLKTRETLQTDKIKIKN